MKYLVCQEWTNTSGNHAGMKHMCSLLTECYPEEYKLILFPDLYNSITGGKYVKKIKSFIVRNIVAPYKYRSIGVELKKKLMPTDTVYLLEYCEKLFPQLSLAKYLKSKNGQFKIYGLIHLVPEKLNGTFSKSEFRKWGNAIDCFLTLGSSLTHYLITAQGVSSRKVSTLFHYVDLNYYTPADVLIPIEKSSELTVVVMGNQKRNIPLLKKVVRENPNIRFLVCQGVTNMSDIFKECNNVNLYGYVSEDELLSIMRQSDVSLNIMEDTIGSNVITTSMAIGLAIVVSDVGSIRDYCDESNSIFCNNLDSKSFGDALASLANNRDRLKAMKQSSKSKSKQFSIQNFHAALSGLSLLDVVKVDNV